MDEKTLTVCNVYIICECVCMCSHMNKYLCVCISTQSNKA